MSARAIRYLARLGRIWVFALLTFVVASAEAATINLSPTKDNTLIETLDGSLSNGAVDRIFVGRTGQSSGSIRRGVLAFDVASAIPFGSTIESVTLTLHLMSANLEMNVSLHRILQDWGEGNSSFSGGRGAPSEQGDATWIHSFFDNQMWSNPGGDYTTSPSATEFIDLAANASPSWTSAQLVSDVQGWVDDPGSEAGWVIIGNEWFNGTTAVFGSRENIASLQPQLTIQYVPEPGTLVQIGLGLGMLAANRRQRRC